MSLSQNLYAPTLPHKVYSRHKLIRFPKPSTLTRTLSDTLDERRSDREYSDSPIGMTELGSLLYWSAGESLNAQGERKRTHPSGGAKYPIEIYAIVRHANGIDVGVYHYNIRDHGLEKISSRIEMDEIQNAFGYSFVSNAQVLLVMTFIKSRSIQKYGALSYKLGLIEAGHIGQNIYLTSNALGIGCCALGGGDTPAMHQLLNIDGGNEHICYAVMCGQMR